MKSSVMIYRSGSRLEWQGRSYDFKVVDSSEVDLYLSDGWFSHPDDVYAEPMKEEEKPQESATEEAPKRRGRPPKVQNVD